MVSQFLEGFFRIVCTLFTFAITRSLFVYGDDCELLRWFLIRGEHEFVACLRYRSQAFTIILVNFWGGAGTPVRIHLIVNFRGLEIGSSDLESREKVP